MEVPSLKFMCHKTVACSRFSYDMIRKACGRDIASRHVKFLLAVKRTAEERVEAAVLCAELQRAAWNVSVEFTCALGEPYFYAPIPKYIRVDMDDKMMLSWHGIPYTDIY